MDGSPPPCGMAQVRVGDPPDLSASGDSFALMFDFPFGIEKSSKVLKPWLPTQLRRKTS